MSWGDYLSGLAFFAGIWGMVGAATWLLVRRRLGHLRGAELALAAALVYTAGLIAAHLLPLALGILTRGTALAAAGLLLVAAWRVPAAGRLRTDPPLPAEPARWAQPVSWALAAVAVGALGLWTLAHLKEHATSAVLAVDYSAFHLPGVARWIQSGSVWQNVELVPRYSLGTYPGNGDVIYLAAVLPWRNDAFVRLVEYPYLALIGVAVYALGRQLRAPRATAVLTAAVVVALPAVMVQAVDRVKPDAMMLACFGAGLVFLVCHCRTRRGSDLALGGLGLGLAFGARWNAAMAVLVVAAVWALASWLGGRAPGRVARDGAALACTVLAAGGFWLVRNLAVTGNPVYPLKVAPLGVTIFGAPRDIVRERYGFSVADYLTNGHVLSHTILPDYRAAFGGPGAFLLVALVLALGWALWRGRPARPVLVGLAAAALCIFVVYLVTPASAQGFRDAPWPGLVREAARWSAPAALIAGALAAWLAGRLGRWRLLVEALAVVAVVDGIHESFHVSGFDLRLTAGLLAAAAVLVAVAVPVARRLRGRGAQVAAAALAGAVVAAGAVAAGYHGQRRFNERRYLGIEPTFDWVAQRAPAGHRIGVDGEFATGLVSPNLPLFGPRLRNSVEYVGPLVEHMRQEYPTRQGLQAALRRGRYDLVLVGRGAIPRDGSPAERWTEQAGYVPVARSYLDVLMARPGAP
jgi:hypothetical protein